LEWEGRYRLKAGGTVGPIMKTSSDTRMKIAKAKGNK
jgi:hypothetical protein